jgi:hypothetical protein
VTPERLAEISKADGDCRIYRDKWGGEYVLNRDAGVYGHRAIIHRRELLREIEQRQKEILEMAAVIPRTTPAEVQLAQALQASTNYLLDILVTEASVCGQSGGLGHLINTNRQLLAAYESRLRESRQESPL